jgi:hypothetical protein
MLNQTIAGAKKGEPRPKPTPAEETDEVVEEGRKG